MRGRPRIAPLLARTVRGDSLDTLWCRVLTWGLMVAHGVRHGWKGRGPGSTVHDLMRWDARYRTTVIHGYAHNEPLQLVYEHGIFGLLAVGLLIWRIAPHLHAGDPWSAATVAGAVLACGTISCRVPPVAIAWLVIAAVTVGR